MPTENVPRPSPEGPPKTCSECQGRGWKDNRCLTPDQAVMCQVCAGKGFNNLGQTCRACQGSGRIEVRPVDRIRCPLCKGAGVYPVPASMSEREFAYRPGQKDKT